MTERTRALVDKKLALVRAAIDRGDDLVEVARLSADVFPLIVDRRCAHACIEAAFTGAHAEGHVGDLEIEPTTVPFVRPDA